MLHPTCFVDALVGLHLPSGVRLISESRVMQVLLGTQDPLKYSRTC